MTRPRRRRAPDLQLKEVSYAPKDLLDSFVDSHQNGVLLGGELARSAGTTTAMDNRLVKVSLNLLTEEVSVQ